MHVATPDVFIATPSCVPTEHADGLFSAVVIAEEGDVGVTPLPGLVQRDEEQLFQLASVKLRSRQPIKCLGWGKTQSLKQRLLHWVSHAGSVGIPFRCSAQIKCGSKGTVAVLFDFHIDRVLIEVGGRSQCALKCDDVGA